MKDLQFALIVIGTCAILGVLVHGLWTIRKNANTQDGDYQTDDVEHDMAETMSFNATDDGNHVADFEHETIDCADIQQPQAAEIVTTDSQDNPVPNDHQQDTVLQVESELEQADDFDEYGVGPVRTVSADEVKPAVVSPPMYDRTEVKNPTGVIPPVPPASLLRDSQTVSVLEPIVPTDKITGVVETTVVEDLPKPSEMDTAAGDSMAISADPADAPTTNRNTKIHSPAQEVPKAKPKRKRRSRAAEEQMQINFDDENGPENPDVIEPKASEIEPELLTLHVSTGDQDPIQGAQLLPLLLTLGFKFGEHDIFHRNEHTDGTGPTLFSLANMFMPGVFDIDNMEQFKSQGIALFMTLPVEGDSRQVFNMMHNAARKIADEFNATILDGQRSTLTKHGVQRYVERIREFERKRMLHR